MSSRFYLHAALTFLFIFVDAEKEYLKKEKKLLEDLERLKAKSATEIERLDAKYVARASKYRRLKNKLRITVSNLTKDVVRMRDKNVKEEVELLCTNHSVPMRNYDFAIVSDNEDNPDISDS